jgi:hypothetical protein
MGCGIGNLGIRRLVDANARFFAAGVPVYYRTRNFDVSNTDAGEMGFQYVPAITGANTGTDDVQICPQPHIIPMNMRMIEAAQAAGAAIRFGAKQIFISHTWVQSVQLAKNFISPLEVFNDKSVVGFVIDGILYEIASFVHNDLYGQILDWTVIINGNDIK